MPELNPPLPGTRRRVTAGAMLTTAALFWAGNYVIGRAFGGLVGPGTLAFARWALAGTVLAPFAARDVWAQRALIRQSWPALSLLGFLGIALFPTAAYAGLRRTTATDAALLLSAAPAVTLAASRVFFGERISRRRWLGVALSTVGVAFLLGRAAGGGGSLVGSLWAATASVTWGIYSALLRLRPAGLGQTAFLAVSVAVGTLALLPLCGWELFSAATGGSGLPHLGRGAWWALAYLVLCPSLLSYGFWNLGTAVLGAARASVFGHFTPLGTVVLGALVLGETLRPAQGFGAALILGGVLIVQRGD